VFWILCQVFHFNYGRRVRSIGTPASVKSIDVGRPSAARLETMRSVVCSAHRRCGGLLGSVQAPGRVSFGQGGRAFMRRGRGSRGDQNYMPFCDKSAG